MDCVTSIARPWIANRLLRLLSDEDFALIAERLEPVSLAVGTTIAAAAAPIQHAYFIESGIVSVVARRSSSRHIEVGIYGRDGMGGLPLLLGSDRSPYEQYMQLPGAGHRIAAADFLRLVERSHSLNRLLLRYVHAFATQTAQTALANGSSPIDERLARWLLMCHDRVDGDILPLTHKFLSMSSACVAPASPTRSTSSKGGA